MFPGTTPVPVILFFGVLQDNYFFSRRFPKKKQKKHSLSTGILGEGVDPIYKSIRQ